jgi:hypothetical protein
MASAAHKRGETFIEILVGKHPAVFILKEKDARFNYNIMFDFSLFVIHVHSSHSEK